MGTAHTLQRHSCSVVRAFAAYACVNPFVPGEKRKKKFVCFAALHPKSTAMAGGSVHLTTLFPGQA